MNPQLWQITTAVVGIANAALFVLMATQLIWRLNHWHRPQRIWFALGCAVCGYFAGNLYSETVSSVPFRPVAVAIGSAWGVFSAGLSAVFLLVDVKSGRRIASTGESGWTFSTRCAATSRPSSRNGERPIQTGS